MAKPINFENSPFTIQTPDKPAPKEEEKKKWTPEEVEDMARVTMEAFGMTPEPKKEPKPDEAKIVEAKSDQDISTPENDPDKPDEPEAPPETQPDKRPKKPAKKKEEPDMADRIAAKIGEENEKLLARITPKPAEPSQPEVPAKSDRDADNEHLRQVFSEMAKMNPANADLAKKFDSFVELESAYISQWEKENPKQVFNPKDHDEWYEENQPDYDERLFRRAEISIEAERLISQREQQRQSETSLQQALTLADQTVDAVSDALEADVKKQLDDLVGENQLLDSDGPIAEKYKSITTRLAEKVTAASVLMTSGTGVAYNPNNPTHAEIAGEVMEMDADITALSEDERQKIIVTALGKKSRLLTKKFVPASEFQTMTPEQQARSWTICAEPALVSKLMAVKAKSQMKSWLDSLFTQVGRKKSDTETAPRPESDTKPTTVLPTPTNSKPSPPGLSQSSSGVTQQPGSSTKPVNDWEKIAANF